MTTPILARLPRTLCALALATILAVASAGVAGADSFHHRGRDGGTCASGKISAFDYARGGPGGYVLAVTSTTLTVESWDGTTTTYTLAATTTYTENNQPVTAATLVVGDRVQVQTAPGTSNATAVTIELAELFGIVSSVNGDTITIIDPEGFTRTIVVSALTTYTDGGQAATLAAVTSGTRIVAQGTIDVNHTTLDALTIEVHRTFSNSTIEGVVTGFTTSSVTISATGGTTATYTLTTSTAFTEGRATTTSAALANGERVAITVSSVAPTTALAVDIQLARVNGVVSGLTADGFTLTTHDNVAVNVVVSANTTFTLDGHTASIASVLAGGRVHVVGALSADGSTLTAQSVKVVGNDMALMPFSSSHRHNDPGNAGHHRDGGWSGR